MYVTFFYPLNVIKNHDLKLVQKIEEDECTLNTGIYLCKLMKDKYGIFPYGFAFVTEEGENTKRVFFNGKIVKDKANKHLDITDYVMINNDFCIPYDKDIDKIMKLTI